MLQSRGLRFFLCFLFSLAGVFLAAQQKAGKLRLEFESFDARPLIVDVLSSIELSARKKNIAIASDLPSSIPLLGDPTRIRQILYNLLSNAVKFTPGGGSIQVFADTSKEMARISVSITRVQEREFLRSGTLRSPTLRRRLG